jgi:hypothetical protein
MASVEQRGGAAMDAAADGCGALAHARAQGLVEYGLILLMIMVGCIVVVTLIGQDVNDAWYQKIVSSWPH